MMVKFNAGMIKCISKKSWAIIPLLASGCLAMNNPPVVPAKEYAPKTDYLWPEDKNQTISEPIVQLDNTNFETQTNFGINNGIIAIVNDHIITLKEFDNDFIQALRQYGTKLDGRELYDEILDNHINRLLLVDFAKTKEVVVEESEIDEAMTKHIANFKTGWDEFRERLTKHKMSLADVRKQLKENLIVRKVDNVLYKGLITPSPKDVLEEYEKRKKLFKQEEMRDISLIVIFNDQYRNQPSLTKKAGQRIIERLKTEDFETVAKQMSSGAKAEEGGRQGFVKKSDLLEDISDAAFKLDKEQHSKLLEMPGGFFVVKCHEIKQSSTKSFQEVQNRISKQMFIDMRRNRRSKVLNQLKQTSYIKRLSANDYLRYRQTLNQ